MSGCWIWNGVEEGGFLWEEICYNMFLWLGLRFLLEYGVVVVWVRLNIFCGMICFVC